MLAVWIVGAVFALCLALLLMPSRPLRYHRPLAFVERLALAFATSREGSRLLLWQAGSDALIQFWKEADTGAHVQRVTLVVPFPVSEDDEDAIRFVLERGGYPVHSGEREGVGGMIPTLEVTVEGSPSELAQQIHHLCFRAAEALEMDASRKFRMCVEGWHDPHIWARHNDDLLRQAESSRSAVVRQIARHLRGKQGEE